jgi:hypothetical protein
MKLSVLIVSASVLLIAANAPAQQTSTPAPGSVAVTPQDFHLPEGGGCAGEIARYRAIQDNDLSMGHVARRVYDQIKVEVAAAERECSAGHDAKARAMVIASKKRHGYPTGL